MKKRILLLLTLLMLTGCNVNYDLEIKDGKIKENTTIHINTDHIKTPQTIADIHEIENNETSPLINDENKKYQKEIKKEGKKITVNLSYQYTEEEFKKARSINQCFTHSIFLDNKEDYYLKLYDGYQCGQDEEYNVTIRIKTENKVIKHNADRIDNNTYIWNLKSKDNKEKEIIFQVSKTEKQKEKTKGNVWIMAFIALSTTALLLFILYLIVQKFVNHRFHT